MASVKETQKMIPFITCEIALCQYVCDLVFGINVFDLDFGGSKLILSNDQSRASLWVRETCLIVGLRPLIIILITASLSSKTYNIALVSECNVCGGMWSMFVGMTLVCLIGMGLCMFGSTTADGFPRGFQLGPAVRFGAELQSRNSREWEREYRPCVNLHREKLFPLLWSCVQLIGTNVWIPKMHRAPPDVDFESSRSPAKSESWNNPSLHCFAVLPT